MVGALGLNSHNGHHHADPVVPPEYMRHNQMYDITPLLLQQQQQQQQIADSATTDPDVMPGPSNGTFVAMFLFFLILGSGLVIWAAYDGYCMDANRAPWENRCGKYLTMSGPQDLDPWVVGLSDR